jgi:hypothetical protein
MIGAPQSPSALLILDSLCSISFHSQFLVIQRSSTGIGTPQSPLSRLEFFYFIPRFSAGDGRWSIPTGAPILDSGLRTHYLPTLTHFGTTPLREHSSIPIGAPLPGLAIHYFIPHSGPLPPFRLFYASLDPPQSPSALCSIDLALFFSIPCFSNSALPIRLSSSP